jgi:peptide deformylase
VGLAAQQVGHPLQLAVVDVAGVEDRPSVLWIDGQETPIEPLMPMLLLNPELVLGKEKEFGTEGCLSFPEITADIQRSVSVKAKARLIDGRTIEFEAAGFLARALQHEVDHLNGILFIDRMNSAAKASLSGKLKRLQRGG